MIIGLILKLINFIGAPSSLSLGVHHSLTLIGAKGTYILN